MATSLIDRASELADKYKVDPTTQDFDESQGVEGRTNRITQSQSPLMQSAATTAAQSMASRGLVNSSLAVGAGQKAVIDSAVPIATADANLSQQQRLANQTARNTAGLANQQSGVTLGGTAMSLENSNEQQGRSLAEQARQFNENQGLTREQMAQQQNQFAAGQTLTREMFATDEAFRQAQLAQQGQQFAAGQTLTREMFASDDAFRQAQLAQQQGQFAAGQTLTREQMAQEGGQFAANLAQQQQQIDAQIAQFAQQLGLSTADLALRRDQLTAQDRQALDQLNLQKSQLAQQQAQFESSQAANVTMFDRELAQKAEQFGLTQAQQTALANLDRQTKIDLASMETANKNAITSNENLAGAWGQMMTNISNIQNNPNLEAATKDALIRNNIEGFRSFANFTQSSANIDVSELLRFGPASESGGGSYTPPPPPPPPPPPDPGHNYTSGD